jgi:hypothetical protein
MTTGPVPKTTHASAYCDECSWMTASKEGDPLPNNSVWLDSYTHTQTMAHTVTMRSEVERVFRALA